MPEKRVLIVDAEVAQQMDEIRGEMSRSDFIAFLIQNLTSEKTVDTQVNGHVSREEFEHFQNGMKDLLRNFLEFFLSYGLELGKQPQDKTFEELNLKLQKLGVSKR